MAHGQAGPFSYRGRVQLARVVEATLVTVPYRWRGETRHQALWVCQLDCGCVERRTQHEQPHAPRRLLCAWHPTGKGPRSPEEDARCPQDLGAA